MKCVMDDSSLKVYETQKQTSTLRGMSTLMVEVFLRILYIMSKFINDLLYLSSYSLTYIL